MKAQYNDLHCAFISSVSAFLVVATFGKTYTTSRRNCRAHLPDAALPRVARGTGSTRSLRSLMAGAAPAMINQAGRGATVEKLSRQRSAQYSPQPCTLPRKSRT
jgi:hypothetical protein